MIATRSGLEETLAPAKIELSTDQLGVQLSETRSFQLKAELDATTQVAWFPSELMQEIFLLALSEKRGPLYLAAVCREWREIACNEPRLWDIINLVMSMHGYISQLHILQAWLKRSGRRPLYITMSLRNYKDQDRSLAFLAIQLLMAESHRWEHIDFDILPSALGRSFDPRGHLPLLRSITIRYRTIDSDILEHDLFYFVQAPLLREATIHYCTSEQVELPWNQLETLNLILSDGDTPVLKLLKLAKNLVTLKLSWPRSGDRPERVRLLKLQNLALVDTSHNLNHLDLPNLKVLECKIFEGLEFSDLSRLVKYSSCRIEELHVTPGPLKGFKACLKLLPSLLQLHVYAKPGDSVWYSSLIGSLLPDAKNDILLPTLKVLVYKGPTNFNISTLTAMLDYRWRRDVTFDPKSPFQLAHLIIKSSNEIPDLADEAIDSLRRLGEVGMEIRIEGGSSF